MKFLFSPILQLRFFAILALGLLALLLLLSPVQAPVLLYKLALVSVAAIAAVFFDYAAFPFATPASYLDDDWRKHPDADNPCNADYPVVMGYERVFAAVCLRRALIICGFVLAVCLGL